MPTIKSLVEEVMTRALIAYVSRRLRREVRKCSTIEDYVDLSYNFHSRLKLPRARDIFSIKPSQIKEEITELFNILVKLRPKSLLEIGTAEGDTLFLFCQVVSPHAKIISIDLPGGPFGGGYLSWKIPPYKSSTKEKQKLYLVRADSHDNKTLEVVKKILSGEMLDFLFIDGDHTYERVKRF